VLKLLAWLFVIYLMIVALLAVLGVLLIALAVWLTVRLIVWLVRRHQARRALRPPPPAPLSERERLLRDVERIIGFRGEARFIREMDERLGNPPDPRYQEHRRAP
jgi:hypothetical protein